MSRARAGRTHTVCTVCKPSLGGVGVSCLEIVSLGFPVSLFYFTQPSRLIFPTCLHMVCGENCYSRSEVREAKPRSRGQDGLTGEIPSLPLQRQACVGVTNIWEHIYRSVFMLFLLATVVGAGRGRKLPAQKSPFSFKFLPDRGVEVVEKPAVICPKHKS